MRTFLRERIDSNLILWKSESAKPTIFVNVSSLLVKDHGGGIQRVQRSLIDNWGKNPPGEYEISPIHYSESEEKFFYVTPDNESNLKVSQHSKRGVVEMCNGDIYLNTDLDYRFALKNEAFFHSLQKNNVEAYTIIYDLLPLELPEMFPEGIYELHLKWFETALNNSKLLCISKTVEGNVIDWGFDKGLSTVTASINLGSNLFESSTLSQQIRAIDQPKLPINFLIVSTIEVRKSHELVLDAFEILWDEDFEVTLTFVGRRGWKVNNLLSRIKSHKNLNKKLFWFEELSDESLEAIYKESTALINASVGEGFGLPLVEASFFGLPLILRDIQIFREVAGEDAWYFRTADPEGLALSLKSWIENFMDGKVSPSKGIGSFSWQDTCDQIVEIIRKDKAIGGKN